MLKKLLSRLFKRVKRRSVKSIVSGMEKMRSDLNDHIDDMKESIEKSEDQIANIAKKQKEKIAKIKEKAKKDVDNEDKKIEGYESSLSEAKEWLEVIPNPKK